VAVLKTRGGVSAPRLWFALTVMGLVLGAAVALRPRLSRQEATNAEARRESEEDERDGGTVAAGDSALTAPASVARPEPQGKSVSLDMPKAPFPGQRRPPCKPKLETEIRGGCWMPHADLKPPCGDDTYEWRGRCFVPSYPPLRPSTSGKPRDL
jgi:hypothetical protein